MKLGLTIAAIVCFGIAAAANHLQNPLAGTLTNIGLALFAGAHVAP